MKNSRTPLVDQNVSNEEAQGINGKTPAKHSAASPKPQGMFVVLIRLVGLLLMKTVQKNDND